MPSWACLAVRRARRSHARIGASRSSTIPMPVPRCRPSRGWLTSTTPGTSSRIPSSVAHDGSALHTHHRPAALGGQSRTDGAGPRAAVQAPPSPMDSGWVAIGHPGGGRGGRRARSCSASRWSAPPVGRPASEVIERCRRLRRTRPTGSSAEGDESSRPMATAMIAHLVTFPVEPERAVHELRRSRASYQR